MLSKNFGRQLTANLCPSMRAKGKSYIGKGLSIFESKVLAVVVGR